MKALSSNTESSANEPDSLVPENECVDRPSSRAGSRVRQIAQSSISRSDRIYPWQVVSPPASVDARATLHIRVSDITSSQSRYILVTDLTS